MKKLLAFTTASALALLFTACGNDSQDKFVGYWHESESDILFEVVKNEQQYVIRNINGDLMAELNNEGKICGKNTLNMPYCMSVKGDEAYYEFAEITTTYKRISKDQYDKIFATKTKATFKPVEQDVPAEVPAAEATSN